MVFIIADHYPAETYTLNVECVIDLPMKICEDISAYVLMRVIIVTICQNHLRYLRVIFASKLSLIIFISLCGPVELLIVHSYVTQLVVLV